MEWRLDLIWKTTISDFFLTRKTNIIAELFEGSVENKNISMNIFPLYKWIWGKDKKDKYFYSSVAEEAFKYI